MQETVIMQFLIQTYGGKITHDFSFTLLESIRYQNWKSKSEAFSYFLTDDPRPKLIKNVVPCGSNEFVVNYLTDHYGKTPRPRNIPLELMGEEFSLRYVFNGDRTDVFSRKFVKSNEFIKGFTKIVESHDELPDLGGYQISDLIDIDSEWRSFVFHNSLVGLQNYGGEFAIFPDVDKIKKMIKAFEPSAPVAYTLDVGINKNGTFVIEVHDFFSCGLYGFADHRIYPSMLFRWFYEFTK